MKKAIVLFLIVLCSKAFAQFNVFGDAAVNIQQQGYLHVRGKLIVNNGLLDAQGKIHVMGDMHIQDTVVLESGASLINYGGIDGTGTFLIRQNLTGGQSHYVSQPVQHASADFFSGGFVHSYNESQHTWQPLASGSILNVMQAYAVYFTADNTLEFTGSPNYGMQSTQTHFLKTGWNLVGNPYPSPVDWESLSWQKSGIDNTLYFWNGTNYSYYMGSNGLTPYQDPIFINNATRYIPSMQGFFIKAHTDGGLLQTSNFTRVHNDQQFFKAAKNERDYPHILLETNHNGIGDQTLIAFFPQATDHFNGQSDAYKLFSEKPEVPQVFSYKNDGTEAAINSLPSDAAYRVIPLGFRGIAGQEYTITCSSLLSDNSSIYLEDRVNGKYTHLNTVKSYSFLSGTSDIKGRFFIHLGEPQKAINGNVFKIYTTDGFLYLENFEGSTEICLYNVLGALVKRFELPEASRHALALPFVDGIYLVRVLAKGQIHHKKIFLKF